MKEYPLSENIYAQILNLRTQHNLSSAANDRAHEFRQAVGDVAEKFAKGTPPSREQSLALTHLEMALFYANAGLARHQPTALNNPQPG